MIREVKVSNVIEQMLKDSEELPRDDQYLVHLEGHGYALRLIPKDSTYFTTILLNDRIVKKLVKDAADRYLP